MTFKAIYMHTKPLKHTKNMQILTNYMKKTKKIQNFKQMSQNGKNQKRVKHKKVKISK